jgi:bacterioferritin (cytochrome b1)
VTSAYFVGKLCDYLADNDPTPRRLMEEILANEEHAEEMKTLLESIRKEENKLDR